MREEEIRILEVILKLDEKEILPCCGGGRHNTVGSDGTCHCGALSDHIFQTKANWGPQLYVRSCKNHLHSYLSSINFVEFTEMV